MRLQGAFGHTVSAEITEIPLGLKSRNGRASQQALKLCAGTEKLADVVDALSTPDSYDGIKLTQAKLEEDSKEKVL